MEFLSINEKAQEWNMSKRRIQILCKEGRITGAKMIGNMWVIPHDAKKPLDARKKSPVRSSNVNHYSKIRRELKSVLKNLYAQVQTAGIEEKFAKKYVLSMLAVSLLKNYLEFTDEKAIFELIYTDLSWDNNIPAFFPEIQECTDEFVNEYRSEEELDDIISWAYQYFNRIGDKGEYTNTQFFTEGYMTSYLVDRIELKNQCIKVVDPCCGGGNFLVACLEKLAMQSKVTEESLLDMVKCLHGYDVDADITKLAVINIKIRCVSILAKNGCKVSFSIWKKVRPNIFCNDTENIGGSLASLDTSLINIDTGEKVTIAEGLCNADFVLTNPPYETVKGMDEKLKDFLKERYPVANCDTCVAFMLAIYDMLKSDGKCGIVSQTAWMHLKSFEKARNMILLKYSLKYVADLGSGAFYDISGEKSNVSLILMQKGLQESNVFKIANLTGLSLLEKSKILTDRTEEYHNFVQKDILSGENGFDYKSSEGLKAVSQENETVASVAVPMQGTSTGNAKQLVGYFWEHFNDTDWVSVSNGGGYCRWQGLNNCVVKWGEEGEYIKEQKGSAIRNAKYFEITDLVYSDTGTAGLNVRKKLDNQIFIASGPGIRVNQGNPLAQLAYLNSRLATYYIRIMSPKLTIAAGYIARLPISRDIYTSIVLEKNAEMCLELKKNFLRKRPNNYEYADDYLDNLNGDVYEAAYSLFISDMEKELVKLEIESHIDSYIISEFELSEVDIEILESQVGVCAFNIQQTSEICVEKLDKYLAGLVDDVCSLKKTKVSKNGMGCDGLLEYASKDLNISPESLVKCFQQNRESLQCVMGKYLDLLLHNEVLRMFEYNTKTGVKKRKIACTEISKMLSEKYEIPFSITEWLRKQFDSVHTNIFKGYPFIKVNEGKLEVIINA